MRVFKLATYFRAKLAIYWALRAFDIELSYLLISFAKVFW